LATIQRSPHTIAITFQGHSQLTHTHFHLLPLLRQRPGLLVPKFLYSQCSSHSAGEDFS